MNKSYPQWKEMKMTADYTGENLQRLSDLYDAAFDIVVREESDDDSTILFLVIFNLFSEKEEIEVEKLYNLFKEFRKNYGEFQIITLGDEEYLALEFIEFLNKRN